MDSIRGDPKSRCAKIMVMILTLIIIVLAITIVVVDKKRNDEISSVNADIEASQGNIDLLQANNTALTQTNTDQASQITNYTAYNAYYETFFESKSEQNTDLVFCASSAFFVLNDFNLFLL